MRPDQCFRCGHSIVYHSVGTGHGVPFGKQYCDDRHSEPCNCPGYVQMPSQDKPEFVVNPDHYKALSPQPIDIIEAWGLNFHRGAAIKYIGRAGRKGTKQDEITDIKKAIGFLQREVGRLEKLV